MKKPINEAHLFTGDVHRDYTMIGGNDQLTNITGRKVEQWLDEENLKYY